MEAATGLIMQKDGDVIHPRINTVLWKEIAQDEETALMKMARLTGYDTEKK